MLRQQLTEQENLLEENNNQIQHEQHLKQVPYTKNATSSNEKNYQQEIQSSSSAPSPAVVAIVGTRKNSESSDVNDKYDNESDLSIYDGKENEDENDDDSNFSYDSEYDDDDDDDDDDEEEDDNANDNDEEEMRKNDNNCCLSSPCCQGKSKKKKRKRRMRNRLGDIEEDDDYDDYDDDDDILLSNQKWERLKPILSPIIKVYQVTKEAFILITNVDDVWDSPALPTPNDDLISRSRSNSLASNSTLRGGRFRSGGGGGAGAAAGESIPNYGSVQSITTTGEFRVGGIIRDTERDRNNRHNANDFNIGEHVTFRHKVGVLFWFLVLAFAYATERGIFKIMIDRMGPFRMVVGVEAVLVVHSLILASWMLLTTLTCGRKIAKGTVMLPFVDIGFMAVLDSIQLLLAVISGSRIAPILTAVLVHFSIPLSTLFNMLFFSDQNNNNMSRISIFGSTLIFISSMLALAPAILTLVWPTLLSTKNVMANRSAWNTILFGMSCGAAAISQIYKEQTLMAFAKPVDQTLLNMLLSLFSFVFTFLISPLFFPLQGLADTPSLPEDGSELKVESWIHQYPSKEISQNFVDAIQCFTGNLGDDVQIRGYPEVAYCDFAFGIVLVYVFSLITINHAIDKICNAGAIKIMHRGISAGIILSVVLMTYYQIFVDDEDYGILPNFYQTACAVVLVIGSEVFHRVSLEKPSFETEYNQVMDLYDE